MPLVLSFTHLFIAFRASLLGRSALYMSGPKYAFTVFSHSSSITALSSSVQMELARSSLVLPPVFSSCAAISAARAET